MKQKYEDLKKKFEKFCEDTGLTITTAFNIFVKKAVREQRIPFEINTDPFYSAANMERLEKARKDAEEGKLTIHELVEDEDE